MALFEMFCNDSMLYISLKKMAIQRASVHGSYSYSQAGLEKGNTICSGKHFWSIHEKAF